MKVLQNNGVLYVEEYTFGGFIKEVQSAILDGWVVDFEGNNNHPSGIVGHYTCGMLKQQPSNTQVEVPETIVQTLSTVPTQVEVKKVNKIKAK